jgi:trimeric autotransporter adhesin
MRSLAGFLVRRSGAGVAFLIALSAAGTTGCSAEFWKGRPDVETVELTITPPRIAEGQTANANGIPRKGNGAAITSSRVRVAYSSSNPAVASVNSISGTITGIAPGEAVITAESQGKSDTETVTVVFADPVNIVTSPPDVLTLTVGASGTVTLDPKGPNGLSLTGRTATFSSSDARVATVTSTGPLTARVTAVSLGTAVITSTIGSKTASTNVLVRLPPVQTVGVALQTGKDSLQVGENLQLLLTLRDPAGNALSTFGRAITYQTSDVTIASVNNATGVVTGVKEGTAEITVTVDGNATGKATLRVIPKRVFDLKFSAPTATLRIGGATRPLPATALDSALNRVDRPITYRSTNEAVATVNNLGLVTPRGLGTTRIVASIDQLTDSLAVTVTQIPITSVRVDPTQATANMGETRQFTATLFDSLGAQVTGRTISWQTNNPNVATVNSSGLVTALAPGSVQVQAFVDVVPGLGQRIGQFGELIVSLTRVARVRVSPDSLSMATGRTTSVTVQLFDANNTELFGRGSTIVARSSNPGVAVADPTGLTGNTIIRGLGEGKTTITFTAVDPSTGLAQGTPATLTVVVQPAGGGSD